MSGVISLQNLAKNIVLELITPEAINTKCLTKALTNKKFIRKQANCGSQVQISSSALLSCLFLLGRDKIDWRNLRELPQATIRTQQVSGWRGDSVNVRLQSFTRKWVQNQ